MSGKGEHPLLAEIKALRMQGLTFKQVGDRLGKTKNQIIGIWNRAGLQNPIRNPVKRSPMPRGNLPTRPPRSRPAPARTLAPEARQTIAVQCLTSSSTSLPDVPRAAASPGAAPPAPATESLPRPFPSRAAFSGGPGRCCAWPIGHPKEAGFRFCDPPLPVGAQGSYCPSHHAIAYTRRPLRDEVAA
ncbi:GcrA family cell cycle regulator [Elioraea sp.]|uniref:GcrA family cell cycle regulator n=1 Tax=Elioraea sp. TaxID=2185103 RepID=UPI0025C20388|nr:GcrA family cell cycle regulator [Elioraea sp.]